MKKKKYFILIILLMVLLYPNSKDLFLEQEVVFSFCEESGVLKVFRIFNYLIYIAKILVPMLLIGKGMISLAKAITNDDDKEIKSSVEVFIKNCITGVFIFFIPTLVNAVIGLVQSSNDVKLKYSDCSYCLTNITKCNNLIAVAKQKEEKYLQSVMDDIEYKQAQYAKEQEEKDKLHEQQGNAAINNNKNEQENIGNSVGNTTTPGTTNPGGSQSPSNPSQNNNGSFSYGKGCTGYVSDNTYNQTIVNNILQRAKSKLGVKYSTMDCSDFVSYVYSSYLADNVVAGLGKNTRSKCVTQTGVKPGDLFFTSRYSSSGVCTNCQSGSLGNRCNRWNCILHVGIVAEVSNGKVTKIIHSSGSGVHESSFSYGFSANGSGKSWAVMFTRPYA